MKRLLLPIVLLSFAVVSLGIVHIDNVNKLNANADQLREKHQTNTPKSTLNDKTIKTSNSSESTS